MVNPAITLEASQFLCHGAAGPRRAELRRFGTEYQAESGACAVPGLI